MKILDIRETKSNQMAFIQIQIRLYPCKTTINSNLHFNYCEELTCFKSH